LSIDDAEATKCLQDQFKSKYFTKIFIFIKSTLFNAENKVKDGRFWVGASSIGCPSVLRWCNLRDNPLVGNHLKWAKGEPSKDPLKECVYLSYSNSTGEFVFAKDSCRTNYLFLCNGA